MAASQVNRMDSVTVLLSARGCLPSDRAAGGWQDARMHAEIRPMRGEDLDDALEVLAEVAEEGLWLGAEAGVRPCRPACAVGAVT